MLGLVPSMLTSATMVLAVPVLIVVLVAGVAQTIAGFGFALISVPALTLWLEPKTAVAIGGVLGLANSAVVAALSLRDTPWPLVARLLVGGFAGMPLGLYCLLVVPADWLALLVGLTSAILSGALASGFRLASRGFGTELAVGLVSGFLNTSTSMNGPPVVLYLQALELEPAAFRGALSAFFVLTGIACLVAFRAGGVLSQEALLLSALGAPVLLLANWLGHRALRRISVDQFRWLVLGLLGTTAVVSVLSAGVRLLRWG